MLNENNTDNVFADKPNHHCGNFVSDGDSGGEFTATTVTNDFNQCATDDELSSLLNQIAVCSQKIIEHSSNNSTNNSSNCGGGISSNSTSSSGCCCSASIEAKCAGICSINHQHHNTNSATGTHHHIPITSNPLSLPQNRLFNNGNYNSIFFLLINF